MSAKDALQLAVLYELIYYSGADKSQKGQSCSQLAESNKKIGTYGVLEHADSAFDPPVKVWLPTQNEHLIDLKQNLMDCLLHSVHSTLMHNNNQVKLHKVRKMC